MATPSRRDVLKLALAASAGASWVRRAAPTRADDPPQKPAVPQPSDIAARLAELRRRVRHLGPPSAAMIRALERIPRSVLVYDLAQIEENYLGFLEVNKDLSIHYAIKACPNRRVLRKVASLGGGFDFASRAELDLALDSGVSPQKCIFSNTVKYPADIHYAFDRGVVAFVADSEYEVRKVARYAPGAKLYVRLLVDNKNAAHPLGEKFGTTPENARRLLKLAKTLGLGPYGTHFHVGTQCYSADAWETPARQAAAIFRDFERDGVPLTLFNIGGGYPAPYLGRTIPTVKEILDVVDRVLRQELGKRPPIVAVEPGRAIVATAAALGARVLLRAPRAEGEWLHLDVGIYHGLNEALDRLVYPVTVAHRSGKQAAFTLCGPSCDSADTISKGQRLPETVKEGDLLVFDIAGAYSECLFTRFNGIEPPAVHYTDDLID
jgi:ornithine decarboxylase